MAYNISSNIDGPIDLIILSQYHFDILKISDNHYKIQLLAVVTLVSYLFS